MRRFIRLAGLSLAAGMMFFACAGTQVELDTIHPDYSSLAPRTVAILPMDNMSVDLDATPLVRPIVHQRFLYRGYSAIALDRVDDALKDNGVLISHDVYGFTPQELGQLLNADAVIYGTVTEFATRYAVVYASVTVGVRLEMADCRTGEILWQSEHYAADDTIEESILIFLTERDIENAIAKTAVYSTAFAVLESYRPFAEQAVRECMSGLPPGYLGVRYYPWDDSDDHFDDFVTTWMYRDPAIRTYTHPRVSPRAHKDENVSPGRTEGKTPKKSKRKNSSYMSDPSVFPVEPRDTPAGYRGRRDEKLNREVKKAIEKSRKSGGGKKKDEKDDKKKKKK